MKNMIWRIALLATWAGAALTTGAPPGRAAEGRDIPLERLERLEQRLNQMAEHQEQLMRQVRGQAERVEQRLNQWPGRSGEPGQERRQAAGRPQPGMPQLQGGPEGVRSPVAPGPNLRPPMLPEGPVPVGRPLKGIGDALGLAILVWLVSNLLMAVWIFTDIRKRGEGAGIFVAMALVAGIPAAVIYALTRIGDKKTASP